MSIEILNVDCMTYMKGLPDNAFDLAIVDPPYGINVNVSMGRRKGNKKSEYKKFAGNDSCSPDIEYFKELKRVSKNQIIWGANHFIDNMGVGINSPCLIMWDKGFSEDVTFAQFEMAWTSFKSSCKKFDKSPHDNERIHPTQKPVELYQWLMDRYAKPGDKILDTHLGSGSSAIAAHYAGYDFVGMELDEHYYELAMKRFKKDTAQLDMF
jgi:site-specific DNA-methyltransferase (adenine-specific)